MVRAGQELALSNLKLLLKVFISLTEHFDLALEAVSIAFQPAFALSAAAFDFIQSAREAGSAVLVHCFAGVSRSTTIVIAYLVHHQHMSFDEAFMCVQQRFCCES